MNDNLIVLKNQIRDSIRENVKRKNFKSDAFTIGMICFIVIGLFVCLLSTVWLDENGDLIMGLTGVGIVGFGAIFLITILFLHRRSIRKNIVNEYQMKKFEYYAWIDAFYSKVIVEIKNLGTSTNVKITSFNNTIELIVPKTGKNAINIISDGDIKPIENENQWFQKKLKFDSKKEMINSGIRSNDYYLAYTESAARKIAQFIFEDIRSILEFSETRKNENN